MNGKLRLSPQLTALAVLVWLGGLLGIYLVQMEKWQYLHAGLLFLQDAIRFLNLPDVFWRLSAERIADVGSVLLLVVSAWCIGLALLRALRWADQPGALTHLIAIAAGLGLWAWFILLSGLAGDISRPLYLWAAIVSLPLIVWHWPWMRKRFQQDAKPTRTRLNGMEIFLVVCLGLGGVLNAIPAFSPEIEYDTLEYHLGALKEYQKAGRIFFLEHNFYASMPSLTEMLYLWAITLRTAAAAKLIHVTFGVLTAIGLISFGKRLHSRQVGLTAAALYYLLPFVTNLADTARIDLATTFFAFLAGAALHRHLVEEHKPWLWLAAMSGGLAMASKYTAGPVVFLPLLLILIGNRVSKGERNVRPVVVFMLLAAIPIVPWLLKNLWFTGNPVYPFANALFHSPYWGTASDALFRSRHAPKFDGIQDWMNFLKLELEMFLKGNVRVYLAGVWNQASFLNLAWRHSVDDSFSSPILFLFSPLFLLVAKPEPRWKFCAWYGCLIYVCWFAFTFRPWRFLFPALPWFALLGAVAVVTLEKERAASLLVRVVLGVMLVFNLNYSFLLSAVDILNPDRIPPSISKLAVFFGSASSTDYLANLYFTQVSMNANLPTNACVLYVGEARTYYANYRVLANTVYDKSIVGEMVAQSHTPEELLKQMHDRGVTHIYINQDEMKRVRQNYDYLKDMNWALFNEFLKAHAKVIFQNNAHAVYELKG